MAEPEELPFVDEHVRVVAATPERTWTELRAYVDRLVSAQHRLLFRVLGTRPRSGFEVLDETPPHEVVLGGRHRFSTYRLVFRVDPHEDGACLRALTYAAFPGLRGRAYRTLLVVSTGHVRATRGMLGHVARLAEDAGA